MLTPKKKISKREIKEDKLVTTYFEATSWYEKNKKTVSTVFTGLVVLVVAAIIIRNNIASSNEKATSEFAKVMKYYDDGNYEAAINGVPQENVRGLQAVVNDYGSSKSGNFAKFYLANAYFSIGKYDKALDLYLDVNLNEELLQSSALAGAGACYEAKGNNANAATYYEKAAMIGKGNTQAAEHLQHAATNFAAAGNKSKAIELLKKIKKDYPTSPLAREIDRYIAVYKS
jgi:tetratricopeptide (TPR) repeat protein